MELTKSIIFKIQSGDFDDRLLDIYVDENVLDYQKERYIKAIKKYEELYGEGFIRHREGLRLEAITLTIREDRC